MVAIGILTLQTILIASTQMTPPADTRPPMRPVVLRASGLRPGMTMSRVFEILQYNPRYAMYAPDWFMGEELDQFLDLKGRRGSSIIDYYSIYNDSSLIRSRRDRRLFDDMQVDISIYTDRNGEGIALVYPTFDGDTLLMVVRYHKFVSPRGSVY